MATSPPQTRARIGFDHDEDPPSPRHAPRPPRRRRPVSRRVRVRRRRIAAAVAVVLAVLIVWLGISLGGALTNPALGSSVSARFAEWARDHGFATVVNWAENQWYAHHQPPKGGRPPKGAIPTGPAATLPTPVGPPHLAVPAAVVSPASPPLAGEGQWHAAGRLVGGIPAVYEAFVRPDTIHTSEVVGIAWMDTKLLHATLYSGSYIPGGGPYTHTAPVSPTAATSLVAAFNAGFRIDQSEGGYFTDGRVIQALVPGQASFVIYRDGSATVGQWGRDVTLTPNVVAVRQNLSLLVDNGQPVPGLQSTDTTKWGLTLGNNEYVWRSGVGVTADGALVYVGGPSLNITTLADLLVRAGAVRAMELDINTDWVQYSTYDPTSAAGAASAANGSSLLSGMAGDPSRYFQAWWSRDFFTMSAAPGNSATGAAARHAAGAPG